MTVQEHANALLVPLDAAPSLVVYDDKVPDDAELPYVRVYVHVEDPEDADSRSLTGTSDRVVARAICHCVGGNHIAARAVVQQVRTAYLDVTPTIAGRKCFPIRHEASVPPQPDESTGSLVMDAVETYRLESVPA